MSEKTFSEYDLTSVLELLNLAPPLEWEIDFKPVEPTPFLTYGLKQARKQITVGSNEWDQRLFMELVFLETLNDHNLRMWQEKQIDAGESPFRGKVDFVFTPYQAKFKMPYLVLSEAKKEDFEQGWGQCLLGMKTCQILNTKDGYQFDMYGIVSTGMFWEFGKFTTNEQFHKSVGYTLAQPETVLGILDYLFTKCEKNILIGTQLPGN